MHTCAILRACMTDGNLQDSLAPARSAAVPGPWATMREPTFRRFWIYSFLAFLGGSMQNVGAGWLMVDLGGLPLQVSLIQGGMSLSVMLAALPSGVMADLYDRRRIMLVALTGMMACTGLIGLLAPRSGLTSMALLAIAFLFGIASAGMTPAMQATVPDLVSLDTLPGAIALNGMSSSAARSVGPGFAGPLIALVGAGATLLANVLAFVGIWWVIARWRGHPPRVRHGSVGRAVGVALRGALRFARRDHRFRALLLRTVACFFGVSAVLALLPSFVEHRFGHHGAGSARPLGALLSCYGVGSVLGPLLVARCRNASTATA